MSGMINEDHMRLLLGLLSLIPLSYFLRFIKNITLKESYSTVIGMMLQLYVFKSYMIPIYLQHLIVFGIIKWRGRKCGALVTFEAMLFLSSYHIYEFMTNYGGWTMNASALLMILVCKYSLLAYNLEDGGKDETGLSLEQKCNRITNEVNFWQYMCYLNFLPTSLMGPPLEYNDFKNFMECKQAYTVIPSVFGITLKTLGETVLFFGLHMFGHIYLPLNPLKTDQFYQYSLAYIFIYSTISVYLVRCKYYFGWKLSMSAVHASGVSFTGQNFSRINTVNPWVFQTSIHVRDKINNWNISVQEWLRKSIYQRSPFKNKTVNQIYVFVVSAFWHGFYSAYYISEALWFVQLHLQTLMFKYFNGNNTIVNRAYEAMGKVGTALLAMLVTFEFSHNSTYFLILEGEYCWKFMERMYFVPEVALFVLIGIFSVLPVPKGKKQKMEAKKE